MATTAVRDAGTICTAALRKIGVVAKDEPADSSDMATAIAQLDNLLKAWQMSGIKRFTRERISVTVTDATTSYSVSPRVLNIETALWRDSDGVDTPLSPLTASEYDELSDKDSTGRATQYFLDRAREATTLYVWPALATAAGETIRLTVHAETEDITSSTDTVEVPREWYMAVEYGLASMLLDDFAVQNPMTRQSIEGKAAAFYVMATDHEREDSVFFSPDNRG